MVATAGPGWRLSPCLALLITETDMRFPSRSIVSDGSIGDPAHASRTSDHNPLDGWVNAVDVTDDDMHGCDVGLLFAHLLARKDKRVKYMIHRGRIVKSYLSTGGPAWTPIVYTGPNAHEKHLHVSIRAEARYSTAVWWPSVPRPAPTPPSPAQEEDDMPTTLWKVDGRPEVWAVSDGLTKTHVPNQAALAFHQALAALGQRDGSVHVIASTDTNGKAWLTGLPVNKS